MAQSEEVGALALGRLWWARKYDSAGQNISSDSIAEIIRGATWLSKVWSEDLQEVLVGVGDQINPNNGTLLTYSDFGTADRALMVGPRPADNISGQPTTIPPTCTYTTPDKPAAEVAAHAAAALVSYF
jgi:hypothetical protein